MEKKIAADIGYRIEYQNGEIAYFGENSGEGNVYKDRKAYESGEGICYISEAVLGNIEGIPMTTDAAITKGAYDSKSFLNDVRFFVADSDIKPESTEDFVKAAAENIFEALEWEEPQTRTNETDWDALADEWNNGKW